MKNQEIFDSWKEIADYLERNVRTCQRWKKELGLPVHHINSKSTRSKVFAYKYEIDEWLKRSEFRECEKISSPNRKWVRSGVVTGIILIFIIFSVFYISHKEPAAPFSKKYSITVLPFKNLNFQDEYFSSEITRKIIASLRKIKEIRVMPFPHDYRVESTAKNPAQIGQELGVDFLLQGTLEKIDNKPRLNVQVFSTIDGKNIFNKMFPEISKKSFSVQDNISSNISEIINNNRSRRLLPKPDKSSVPERIVPGNFPEKKNKSQLEINNQDDSWKLYDQGKYYLNKSTLEGNEQAQKYFQRAVELDDRFAQAYLGLAQCYTNYVNFDWDSDIKWLNKAEDLIQIAQKINPDLPEYYCTMIEIYLIKEIGFNKNTKNFAYKLAEEGLKKFPNHPQLNSIAGYCYYLKFGEEGKKIDFDRTIKYKEKNYLLRPDSFSNIIYAKLLMLNREFIKAINVCNTIKKDANSQMIQFRLGEIYYYFGYLDKSKQIFQQFEMPSEYRNAALIYLGKIAVQKGKQKEVQRIIQDINIQVPEFSVYHLDLASIYMGLGDKERGYRYLRSFFSKPAVKKMRYVYHKQLELDRNFDRFRNERRFKKIINNE